MEMNGGIRNSAIMGAKKRIAMMKNGTNEAGSAANDDLSKCNEWTQTGYKSTVVGMTLYALVVLAFWIIQFLLFALTVEYCEFLTPCWMGSYPSKTNKSFRFLIISSHYSLGYTRCATRSNHLVHLWLAAILRRSSSIEGI